VNPEKAASGLYEVILISAIVARGLIGVKDKKGVRLADSTIWSQGHPTSPLVSGVLAVMNKVIELDRARVCLGEGVAVGSGAT